MRSRGREIVSKESKIRGGLHPRIDDGLGEWEGEGGRMVMVTGKIISQLREPY